jgi:hypothetical protein
MGRCSPQTVGFCLSPDRAQAGLQHLSDFRRRGDLIEEIAKIGVGPLAVALSELSVAHGVKANFPRRSRSAFATLFHLKSRDTRTCGASGFPSEVQRITFGPTDEDTVVAAPIGRSQVTSMGPTQHAIWIRDPGSGAA